ncbi:MAG: pyridoxal 5'-phosphate synthase glutaminase subunit PdxT [Thermoplasmata archaeon]|nr:pyridoxal 5'-phosphate synthase glutaminase subunit PdxT [Thermoplasmata archaeon]
MKVGVLGLQGDVPEHLAAVSDLLGPRSAQLVRSPEDLRAVDALLLPGGESTTIADLLQQIGLWNPLKERIADGLPVLATCAGMILLSTRLDPVPGGRDPPTMGPLEIDVRRNDYGSQRESFEAPVKVAGLSGRPFPGVFIRAPRILKVRGTTKTIAKRGEEIVGVRRKSVVGLTFHPELSGDPRLLAWFLRETVGRAPS